MLPQDYQLRREHPSDSGIVVHQAILLAYRASDETRSQSFDVTCQAPLSWPPLSRCELFESVWSLKFTSSKIRPDLALSFVRSIVGFGETPDFWGKLFFQYCPAFVPQKRSIIINVKRGPETASTDDMSIESQQGKLVRTTLTCRVRQRVCCGFPDC